jgi:hypothetical protein
VQYNQASGRFIFSGPTLALAKAVADTGHGGHILATQDAFFGWVGGWVRHDLLPACLCTPACNQAGSVPNQPGMPPRELHGLDYPHSLTCPLSSLPLRLPCRLPEAWLTSGPVRVWHMGAHLLSDNHPHQQLYAAMTNTLLPRMAVLPALRTSQQVQQMGVLNGFLH